MQYHSCNTIAAAFDTVRSFQQYGNAVFITDALLYTGNKANP